MPEGRTFRMVFARDTNEPALRMVSPKLAELLLNVQLAMVAAGARMSSSGSRTTPGPISWIPPPEKPAVLLLKVLLEILMITLVKPPRLKMAPPSAAEL